VRAFAATAVELAYVPEGPAPPAALRERILVTARAERQNVVSLSSRRRSPALVVAAALAVAASAAAVGIGVWAATLHSSLTHAQKVEAVIADPGTRRIPLSGAAGALYVAPSGRAALAIDLPKPPAGKTYEAWVVAGAAAPQPAGVFSGNTTLLNRNVQPRSVVKVTVERSGGATRPTTAPIVSAQA
jgi:hypothetical protein